MNALQDHPTLAAFLDAEPAATIAVPIDEAGTIHAATLLFVHTASPLRFYFVTSRETEKCTLLVKQESVPAACVVGTYRDTEFTLQLRGRLSIVDKNAHADTAAAYYAKRGNHNDDLIDPVHVLLEFVPEWARYTDYANNYKRTMLDV